MPQNELYSLFNKEMEQFPIHGHLLSEEAELKNNFY